VADGSPEKLRWFRNTASRVFETVKGSAWLSEPFSFLQAVAVFTFGQLHLMKFFSDFFVFLAEEDFTERMTVRGKHAAASDRDGQPSWTRQTPGRRLMVLATIEADNPCLRATENFIFISSDDHLTGRIECAYARKDLFCTHGLIGNELYRIRTRLAVDPFVKAAAHSAATIVVNFNPLYFFG